MAHPGYCTQADLEARYRAEDVLALADYDQDGVADVSVIAHAIEDAALEMDSYLGVLFAVPIVPAPDALRPCATIIAHYYLRLGRQSVTEDARTAYDNCITRMKAIAAGTVNIGVAPVPAPSAGSPGVRYDVKPRVFGRDEPL